MKLLLAWKFGMLMISTIGWWELLCRKTKIDKYFIPAVVVAVQICILLIAGYVGILPVVSYMMVLFGISEIIYILSKERSILFFQKYTDLPYLVFFGIIAIMAIFVQGKRFGHWDSFSHWGLVVQNMLDTNHIPSAADTLIKFQAYPLGSSLFLYYWCRVTTGNEPVMMLAQIYMTTAAILPMFCLGKQHKNAIAAVVLSATNMFFAYNVYQTELQVDTLLPVVSMCALLYLYCYGVKAENRGELWFLACFLIQIVQIKNSGIFFYAVIMVCALFGARKVSLWERLVIGIIPLFAMIIWRIHLSVTFPSAETSTHAMTIENYARVLGDKSITEIIRITKDFIKYAIKNNSIWFCMGCLLISGGLICLYCKKMKSDWIKCAVFSVILYCIYMVGQLGMYMFSMSKEEALRLASIDRYTKSIIIAIIYVLICLLISVLSELEKPWHAVLYTSIWAVVIPVVLMYGSLGEVRLAFRYMKNDDREWINRIKREYMVPEGEEYSVFEPYTMDSNMVKYVFRSGKRQMHLIQEEEDLKTPDQYYRYILIRDIKNEAIQDWVIRYFPDQVGREVIVQQ